MKIKKRSVAVEKGMERLASFIKDNHGSQDWENVVHDLQDYLAAFIGASGTEVHQDLMERMTEEG
jgi:hypothetical protein